jgi:outer membrane protein assembly factor BamD (BamD/ComL family)
MSPEAKEAAAIKEKAEDTIAEHYYDVGRWYVKMGKRDAALVYFNKVLAEYSDTRWAGLSKAGIDSLSAQARGGNGS